MPLSAIGASAGAHRYAKKRNPARRATADAMTPAVAACGESLVVPRLAIASTRCHPGRANAGPVGLHAGRPHAQPAAHWHAQQRLYGAPTLLRPVVGGSATRTGVAASAIPSPATCPIPLLEK